MRVRKPQTPQSPLDNPDKYRRFLDMAYEVEVDEGPSILDRELDNVAKSKALIRSPLPPRDSAKPDDQPLRQPRVPVP